LERFFNVPELKQIGKINKGSQGQRIYDINGLSVTLGALGGGQGAKTGLYAVPEIIEIDGIKYIVDYSRVRRLMPRECARVMGFLDDFKIVVSDTQAYKQFGNAVVPGVVKEISKAVIKIIFNKFKSKEI
jgi:DNA (cytosine-5)-methyltransferase 1